MDLLKLMVELLFDCSWFDETCDGIKYLPSEKSSIADSINRNFARIRIDSHNSLPIENILTFHNAIVLIRSIVNKYKNHYYANIFLGKGSYKDKSGTKSFLLINISNKCLYIINTIFW